MVMYIPTTWKLHIPSNRPHRLSATSRFSGLLQTIRRTASPCHHLPRIKTFRSNK